VHFPIDFLLMSLRVVFFQSIVFDELGCSVKRRIAESPFLPFVFSFGSFYFLKSRPFPRISFSRCSSGGELQFSKVFFAGPGLFLVVNSSILGFVYFMRFFLLLFFCSLSIPSPRSQCTTHLSPIVTIQENLCRVPKDFLIFFPYLPASVTA